MKKFTVLAVGALLLAGITTSANALSIRLVSGSDSMTLSDNSLGDINPTTGAVTFIGSVGDFVFNVSTGISKPVLGSASNPFMDLVSVDISSNNASPASLQIFLTDTNFTASVPGFKADIGGTTMGTVKYKTYLDSGNNPFGTSTLLTDATYQTGPFSGSAASGLLSLSGLYSLTQEIDITHAYAGVTSFDAAIAPVPEPGTMVLLGVGLLGLAIYGKRRMNRTDP